MALGCKLALASLLRVVGLAGQVAKQAALADPLLPNEHELSPVQPLLAAERLGVVGSDRWQIPLP